VTDYQTMCGSESGAHQNLPAHIRNPTTCNHGSPCTGIGVPVYPPGTPSQGEQGVSHGPLDAKHGAYEKYDVQDGDQRHQLSDVRSINKKKGKKARRSKKFRNTYATTTHMTPHAPPHPCIPSNSLYEHRPTSVSPCMFHSPLAPYSVPASHCSLSPHPRARSQLSPSPKTLHHAPNGIPSPMPYGQYWPIPAQHMIIPAHYPSHLHPVSLATSYPFVHPAASDPTVLSPSPELRCYPSEPISIAQPVPIHWPSDLPFRTHSLNHPSSYPEAPAGDTFYGPHPHTNAAANGSVCHRAAQTPDCPPSGKFPQFDTGSWRYEEHSGMNTMPQEATSSSRASPTWSSQRTTTRKASVADEPERANKRARKA
jgi:hypothetical protein